MPPLPTCATSGCNLTPPAIDTFACAPTVTDGEVTEILLTDTPLTAEQIADAELFEARIDNTAVAAGAIVRLKCTGKFTAGEPTFVRVEGGVQVPQARKQYGVEVEFYNDSEVNYNAMRKLSHCSKPLIMYFIMGGKIYGGTANVEDGQSTYVVPVPTSEGVGTYLKYVVKASWEATCMPARAAYPLAA